MLRQGIAIICRTREEWDALGKVVVKEKYFWRGGQKFNYRTFRRPTRISFNIETNQICMSRCENLDYPLNYGITEVYEASDFLHNIIISMRLKGE
jgi:hypothetical protein